MLAGSGPRRFVLEVFSHVPSHYPSRSDRLSGLLPGGRAPGARGGPAGGACAVGGRRGGHPRLSRQLQVAPGRHPGSRHVAGADPVWGWGRGGRVVGRQPVDPGRRDSRHRSAQAGAARPDSAPGGLAADDAGGADPAPVGRRGAAGSAAPRGAHAEGALGARQRKRLDDGFGDHVAGRFLVSARGSRVRPLVAVRRRPRRDPAHPAGDRSFRNGAAPARLAGHRRRLEGESVRDLVQLSRPARGAQLPSIPRGALVPPDSRRPGGRGPVAPPDSSRCRGQAVAGLFPAASRRRTRQLGHLRHGLGGRRMGPAASAHGQPPPGHRAAGRPGG